METEATNQIISVVEDLGKSVLSLSGAGLTILVCLVIGYAITTSKTIPNNIIPFMMLAAGGLIYPFVSPPVPEGSDITNPWVRDILFGFLFGFVARLLHQAVLRKLLRSKWFKDDGTMPPFPPAT